MARASVVTQLSLDRFFQILGIHPLYSNQVIVESLAPSNYPADILMQYAWQVDDRVGREDVATAIQTAENRLEEYLGFRLKPTWELNEKHSFGTGYRGTGLGARWGYFQSGGVQTKTVLEASAAVVYTDGDTDGYKETATITLTGLTDALTSSDEIRVYFPGESGSDEWEVRPIRITAFDATAHTATIVCKREQLVKPELQDDYNPVGVNGDDDDNFLSTVDVYRVYNDPASQLTMIYGQSSCTSCSDATCPECESVSREGCLLAKDNRNSLLSLNTDRYWDSGLYSWLYYGNWAGMNNDGLRMQFGRRASINYLGGWRNEKLRRPLNDMDPLWEKAVAYYAAALIDRPMVAGKTTENILNRWAIDYSLSQSGDGGGSSYKMDSETLANPFGTTVGAIYAWNVAKREKIGEAACVR